jgi:predicted metal-dependent HD superfamily phosphohydrolase
MNENRDAFLAREWHRLMDVCKVPMDAQRDREFARILEAYAQPHRHYHNLDHIDWMIGLIFETALGDPVLMTRDISLATWYHDVVYDPRRGDNEGRSAEEAAESLSGLGVPVNVTTRVRSLILMTQDHVAPENDPEADLFLDADLGILGADPATYARYADAIRREYSWVNDADFNAGRRKVLLRFLDRKHIYSKHGWHRRHLEERARANLAAEIAQIDDLLRALPT